MLVHAHEVRLDEAPPGTEPRLDRMASVGTLRQPVKNDAGALVGEMLVASTGVLVYTSADDPRIPAGQQRRERVDADTLSDPEWLASLRGVPLIWEHVPSVNPRNVNRLRIGQILGARYEDGATIADFVVDTEQGLRLLDKGYRDVSPGYAVRLDSTPGIDPVYGAFDATQRGRRANHVALTRAGRGPLARLRADSHEATMDLNRLLSLLALTGLDLGDVPADLDEDGLVVRLDSAIKTTGATVLEQARQATADAETAAEAARQEAATARADAATAQAQADALRAQVEQERQDAANAAVQDVRRGDGEAFIEGYTYRVRLDALASRLGVKVEASTPTTQVAEAIVRHAIPDAPKDASEAYVRAAIDMIGASRQDSRFNGFRGKPVTTPAGSRQDGATGQQVEGVTAATMNAIKAAGTRPQP